MKKYIYLFSVFLLVFCGIAIFEFSFEKPDPITSCAEAVIIMALALFYFFRIFVNMSIPRLTEHYFFWLNSAFLIYFPSTFLISLFEDIIRNSPHYQIRYLWIIRLFVNIIFNILLTVGICKVKRI
jgi:hypothetical protein